MLHKWWRTIKCYLNLTVCLRNFIILVHMYLLHTFFRTVQYFVLYMHQNLFRELPLTRYFVVLSYFAASNNVSICIYKYIFEHNMGIFEFPVTEILVPKCMCILNYKIYCQEQFPSIAFKTTSLFTLTNSVSFKRFWFL